MTTVQMNTRMQMPAVDQSNGNRLFGADPLALTAGWRAFQAYRTLSEMSDKALAAKGLTRDMLPQAALKALKRGL